MTKNGRPAERLLAVDHELRTREQIAREAAELTDHLDRQPDPLERARSMPPPRLNRDIGIDTGLDM